MKLYFVYIVECCDKSFYIGVTNNINRRIIEHNEGINVGCYTYSRRPVVLKYTEETKDILAAIAREKQIKRWSRKKKLALIKNKEKHLKLYSKRSGVYKERSWIK